MTTTAPALSMTDYSRLTRYAGQVAALRPHEAHTAALAGPVDVDALASALAELLNLAGIPHPTTPPEVHWPAEDDPALADWRAEVANGDTVRSFHDWRTARDENNATPADLRPGLTFSRGQVEAWVGHALTDEQVTRLADTLPDSTLPDTVSTVATDALGFVDPAEDTDWQESVCNALRAMNAHAALDRAAHRPADELRDLRADAEGDPTVAALLSLAAELHFPVGGEDRPDPAEAVVFRAAGLVDSWLAAGALAPWLDDDLDPEADDAMLLPGDVHLGYARAIVEVTCANLGVSADDYQPHVIAVMAVVADRA